jgi:hypothetical protein
MKRASFAAITTLLAIGTTATALGLGVTLVTSLPRGPVVDWSLEAQRAIVPPPAGVGNKFPGEAAVYWESFTSRCTTPLWRSRAATVHTRSRLQLRPIRLLRPLSQRRHMEYSSRCCQCSAEI